MALALIVAAAALVVIGTPRIPAVWSFVWGIGDELTGGVEDRKDLLEDHPFPATLAPPGYRVERFEPMVDPDGTRFGAEVSFTGPDDENLISFYGHAMIAPTVEDYWRRPLEVFGQELVADDVVGPHSFCHEGDDVFHETHGVECVAAFDGLAVIARSANTKPGRGNLEHARTLLRAGVEYWELIRDY